MKPINDIKNLFIMKNMVIIGFLVIANVVFAQSWQWQNPLPQGNILEDVTMIDESVSFAAGRGGTIIKTTNGGITWTILPTGTLRDIYSLFFFDANLGYAVGDTGLILKTNDGGLTLVM
jgi:photosystem II stability/assembly factor-like uncharacterized protein